MRILVLALTLIGLSWPISSATAQGLETPRLIIGGFGSWASDDAQRPDRFNYEPTRDVWSAHAGLFVTPRLAVGVEWAHLGTIEAPGGTSRAQITELHREHALFGTVRGCLVSQARYALDVVGGAGAVFQRRESRFRGPEAPATDRIVAASSPAYVLRIEPSVTLTHHVALTPTVGIYALRRDDVTADAVSLSRTRPSTRGFAGVGAAVTW